MSRPKMIRSLPYSQTILYVFCAAVTILLLLMFIPVSLALSAGIAAVSVVVFGIASLVLLGLLIFGPAQTRSLVGITFIAAVVGLLVPQLAFLKVASNQHLPLTFQLTDYLHFSGETTMTPKRIVSYKTLGRHHLKLAVYQPPHLPASKTVILLHGGGWRYGNYLQTGEWPQHLTERGMAVVSVQYRLASSATPTWNKAPSDVSDAVTYLEKHAAELGVPASNFTIMGQSAGGHLALLEAYKNTHVNAVVALYAPVDPALDYRTSRDKSAELDFIGGPPGQYPDRYKQLSPLTYLSPASPRTLLIQGKSDDLVDVKNAIVASDALKANRVDHELLILPLTGHSFENQHGGFATQLATEKVLRFLNK